MRRFLLCISVLPFANALFLGYFGCQLPELWKRLVCGLVACAHAVWAGQMFGQAWRMPR